jgi:mono/diheme cytochrome c family protein
VSDRKPTDFPIARGVSPPPRPIRRPAAAAPSKAPLRRANTIVEPQFTLARAADRVIVRRPKAAKRWSVIALQAGAVVFLAGLCMAAGWWFVHRGENVVAPRPSAPVIAKAEWTKPAIPLQPIENPPAPKAVEKPIDPPPTKPTSKSITPPPAPSQPAPAPKASAEKPKTTLTFQKDIQPILQAKCVLCHGDRNKFKGGLDLRTLRNLEKGGESGPAINRQDPETSPLWDSVSSGQMPPGKNKLSESEKKKLHDWLVGGGK